MGFPINFQRFYARYFVSGVTVLHIVSRSFQDGRELRGLQV